VVEFTGPTRSGGFPPKPSLASEGGKVWCRSSFARALSGPENRAIGSRRDFFTSVLSLFSPLPLRPAMSTMTLVLPILYLVVIYLLLTIAIRTRIGS
jgi:hypothetical protein